MRAIVFHGVGDIRLEKVADPRQRQPLASAVEAYRVFAEHRPGWVKVELDPAKV